MEACACAGSDRSTSPNPPGGDAAELGAGEVTLRGGPGDGTVYNVSWGFAEVLPDRVTILANDALRPDEIDVPRAEEQLDRGLRMWKEAGDSEEAYTEALRVIFEAEAKIASATGTEKA